MSAASRRKRKGKPATKAPRQDFAVRQVRAATAVRTAPMRYPVRCKWCSHVHDAAKVTVVDRFKDCSVWKCPGCGNALDDRPERWGGSALPVEPPPPPARRDPKRLPWEGADQPDHVDPAIAQLMRHDVARRPIRTQYPPRLTDKERR